MHARRTLVGLLATSIVGGGLVAAQVAHAKSARAATRTATDKPAAVETPDVIAALQKTGAYLRNLQTFAVKAEMTADDERAQARAGEEVRDRHAAGGPLLLGDRPGHHGGDQVGDAGRDVGGER